MTEHTPSDGEHPTIADDGNTPAAPAPDPPAPASDWNPRGPRVRRDALAAYDELRSQCPVARGPDGAWTLFTHAHVVAAALDHESFSNAASRYTQVPNGLDGPTHSAFRTIIDTYFTRDRMSAVEPAVRRAASGLVAQLDVPGPVDAVDLGARFAVRAQSAWLGWPVDLEPDLLQWVSDNTAASRSRDPARTTDVARRFDSLIRNLIDARREAGAHAPADVTSELMRERVGGRELTDDEIVSILRNWTGGDLGSMALCVGVVLAYLADHPDLQARLRAGVPDRELDAVLDEILRLDDPFVSNRRVATGPVTVGGRQIAAGDRVVLNWTAANRDPAMFGDDFDPVGHAPDNLVYGIGKHVCPGRPLATLELRVLTTTLLRATAAIEPDPDRPRERALPPIGGFTASPILLR